MIGIYLRPDETQVVEADIKKDHRLHVLHTYEADAFFDGVLSAKDKGFIDEESAERELANLFTRLNKNFSLRSENVYIVLPDFLFSAIECYEYISDDNIMTEVEKTTGEPIDAFYLSMPIMTNPPAPVKKTVFVIRKEIIDRIVTVCSRMHISLYSVEPASMGFFRSIANWSLDHPVVEIFEESASIVTYSPAGGIFRHDTPELSLKNLREQTLKANDIISSAYAMNNFASSDAFSHMRTDAEFSVLCANSAVFEYPSIRLHLPKNPFTFSDIVEHPFDAKDEVQWMPVVGVLLSELDALFADSEDNPLYHDLPAFVQISSSNLLPPEVQKASQNRQWQQIVKRVGRYVIAASVFGMVLEGGAAFYFNSAEISPKLQQEYDAINSQKADIEGEMAVLKAQKQEDLGIMEAYEDITAARPQDCGFTDLTIGNNNPTANNSKLKFAKVNVVAKNEMAFQDFRAGLETMDSLQNPTVTTIKGDASGLQSATIDIQKKGAKVVSPNEKKQEEKAQKGADKK